MYTNIKSAVIIYKSYNGCLHNKESTINLSPKEETTYVEQHLTQLLHCIASCWQTESQIYLQPFINIINTWKTQCMASRFTQKLARWDLFSSISQNSSQNRLQKMYQLAAIFRQWQPGSCWCDISHVKSSVEDYINRMMDSTQFHSMHSDIPGAKPWWVHRKFTELWWFNGPNVDWTITTETLHISPYNIAPRS